MIEPFLRFGNTSSSSTWCAPCSGTWAPAGYHVLGHSMHMRLIIELCPEGEQLRVALLTGVMLRCFAACLCGLHVLAHTSVISARAVLVAAETMSIAVSSCTQYHAAGPRRYAWGYVESRQGVRRGDRLWQLSFGSGFKCNSATWTALRDCNEQVRPLCMTPEAGCNFVGGSPPAATPLDRGAQLRTRMLSSDDMGAALSG